jgi:ketosteroid isomerase-like protein
MRHLFEQHEYALVYGAFPYPLTGAIRERRWGRLPNLNRAADTIVEHLKRFHCHNDGECAAAREREEARLRSGQARTLWT